MNFGRPFTCRLRFCFLVLVSSVGFSLPALAQLRVLTIGNSFANDATRYLQELADSQGVQLHVERANLGGCDLEQHHRHLQAYLENPADPEGSPYSSPAKAGKGKRSLVEALRSQSWNVVTIQQVSWRSFDPDTHEPHARALINVIRRHAPLAEILVHQTWAYRTDHPWFQGDKQPGIGEGNQVPNPVSQERMHASLAAAYDDLAARYFLRVIPVGDAFQRARSSDAWRFSYPDSEFDYTNPPLGKVPRQAGSLTVGWAWAKNWESGQVEFQRDSNHANEAGCYLGASVWFETITGKKLGADAWHPAALDAEQAASLRTIAGEAVAARAPQAANRLQPYAQNPRYWQWKGRPVLLLGGSRDDNLFQIPDLVDHLDEIRRAGGNYVRNTMSDRVVGGFEVSPFGKTPGGKYDLNTWNEDYWRRFHSLLREASARDIVVQIELWDRFDHSRAEWQDDPYNPKNNVNYTYEESGFATDYPNHPGSNEQPFFFTTPLQHDNRVVRPFQEAFVRRVLSYSLQYDNVLYCLDNETAAEDAWATYWAGFAHREAAARGKKVFLTEMWNSRDPRDAVQRRTLDHPERYGFLDISQINHVHRDEHWTRLQWARDYVGTQLRPINLVKVYGEDGARNGGSAQLGIERFVQAVIGGAASVRFHRPGSGLGLSDRAIAVLRSMRKLELRLKPWEMEPTLELLRDREPDEAYLAAKAGETYALFFPEQGEVSLDLAAYPGTFRLEWVEINTGSWGAMKLVRGGDAVRITAPGTGPWVAILTRVAPAEEASAWAEFREATTAPYPPSEVIAEMRLDWATHRRSAPGSDNFQLTWSADDHLYGSWGDGGGFGGTNNRGRVSLGVGRVEGAGNDYRGYNVWGGHEAPAEATFDGKSWGMIAVGTRLFWWVVPDVPPGETLRNHYAQAVLYESADRGLTWSRPEWAFTSQDELTVPTFLNFGRGGTGVPEELEGYVYSYFVRPETPGIVERGPGGRGLIAHRPGELFLSRAKPDRLTANRDAHEFFAGFDKNGRPQWGTLEEKRPVFHDPNGVGWCLSAQYHPTLKRYLLVTQHHVSETSNLGFFDAPTPWGPWTTVAYHNPENPFGWRRPGSGLSWDRNVFFGAFPTKWFENDAFVLTFTGAGRGNDNDSFNTVRGTFVRR